MNINKVEHKLDLYRQLILPDANGLVRDEIEIFTRIRLQTTSKHIRLSKKKAMLWRAPILEHMHLNLLNVI